MSLVRRFLYTLNRTCNNFVNVFEFYLHSSECSSHLASNAKGQYLNEVEFIEEEKERRKKREEKSSRCEVSLRCTSAFLRSIVDLRSSKRGSPIPINAAREPAIVATLYSVVKFLSRGLNPNTDELLYISVSACRLNSDANIKIYIHGLDRNDVFI